MAILTSITNAPKSYDLSKSTIHEACSGIQPKVYSVHDLIAQEGLRQLQEQVRIRQLGYHYTMPPPKVNPTYHEKNTVHFLGRHTVKAQKVTVFDTAMRQSHYEKQRLFERFKSK